MLRISYICQNFKGIEIYFVFFLINKLQYKYLFEDSYGIFNYFVLFFKKINVKYIYGNIMKMNFQIQNKKMILFIYFFILLLIFKNIFCTQLNMIRFSHLFFKFLIFFLLDKIIDYNLNFALL